jgi:hypothetical protein
MDCGEAVVTVEQSAASDCLFFSVHLFTHVYVCPLYLWTLRLGWLGEIKSNTRSFTEVLYNTSSAPQLFTSNLLVYSTARTVDSFTQASIIPAPGKDVSSETKEFSLRRVVRELVPSAKGSRRVTAQNTVIPVPVSPFPGCSEDVLVA